MSTQSATIVQPLWTYCNILRDDGVSFSDYVEQLTSLLFLIKAGAQKLDQVGGGAGAASLSPKASKTEIRVQGSACPFERTPGDTKPEVDEPVVGSVEAAARAAKPSWFTPE